jgi:hypothetical protein
MGDKDGDLKPVKDSSSCFASSRFTGEQVRKGEMLVLWESDKQLNHCNKAQSSPRGRRPDNTSISFEAKVNEMLKCTEPLSTYITFYRTLQLNDWCPMHFVRIGYEEGHDISIWHDDCK